MDFMGTNYEYWHIETATVNGRDYGCMNQEELLTMDDQNKEWSSCISIQGMQRTIYTLWECDSCISARGN